MSDQIAHNHEAENAECGCKPGAHDEGWQERRSTACEQAELDGWREMLARYRANHGVVTTPGASSGGAAE